MAARRSIDEIADYHVHVYYDEASKPVAESVVEAMREVFPDAAYGRWHDKPIGPHPIGSIQVAFGPDLFREIVSWLMLNRAGLTILVHPNTGDDLADHRDQPLWLGEPRALNLAMFGGEDAA